VLRMSRFVIPANAGIQLSLLILILILILIHLPVVGAEQRSRTSGKGASV
jgi:hypothetical protein